MAGSLISLATASDIYFDAVERSEQSSGVVTADRQRLLAKERPVEAAAAAPVATMQAEQKLLLPSLYDELDPASYEDAGSPLTMDEYAESLARMITDHSLPLPLLMGLLGPRSSGKTHLIKAMLWKLKRICSFSCSNLGARVRPCPVRWRYNLCGSLQGSFFCYLALLATLFALLVMSVVAFTIYASVVYTVSLDVSIKNGSAASTLLPPTQVVATTTVSAGLWNTTTAETVTKVLDIGTPIIEDLLAAPGQPAASNSVQQKRFIEQEAVMYPLYACGVVVAFCLLVTMLCALIFCCGQRSNSDDADPSEFWVNVRAILVMLLCETPPSPRALEQQEIEIIPVTFNAYEYSGSNMLWAGIVTRLFEQIESAFGRWKVRFYRMFVRHTVPHVHDEHVVGAAASLLAAAMAEDGDCQPQEQQSATHYSDDSCRGEQKGSVGHRRGSSRGGRCCSGRAAAGSQPPSELDVLVHSATWKRMPYAVLAGNVIALLSLSILIVVLFAVKAGTAKLATIEQGIQIAAGALFGVTVLTQAQKIWALVRVVWSSQSSEVVKETLGRAGKPDFSEHLGFMHDVCCQVAKVTDFVKLMERLYRKRFRVLVIFDALDRCELPKIVHIIEAVNLLLSDEESHFVTVLAVDHNSVNQALVGKVTGNSAQFMQQLFQVRFCMPDYCEQDVKLALSRNCTGGGGSCSAGRAMHGDVGGCGQPAGSSGFVEWQLSNDSSTTAARKAREAVAATARPASTCSLREHADRVVRQQQQEESFELTSLAARETKDLERLRQKLCRWLTLVAVDELSRSSQLLPLSYKFVRDLRNVVFCTLCMWTRRRVQSASRNIVQLEAQLAPLCRLFACWIFLVEVWPYRCSWILYHVGTMEEHSLGSGKVAASKRLASRGAFDDMKLSDLYAHVRTFVKTLDDWKYWISNDGDPDTFEITINQFPLTVKLMKQFLPFTTNLDRCIKKAIADYCNMHGDAPCSRCIASSSRFQSDAK